MTVRLIVGDALEQLRLLPASSVHCCVTSPPYYGLRDYGVARQIGLESSPDEYVAALVAVFREVRRVLRSDGTLWLNIGDSYAGGKQGRADTGPEDLARRAQRYAAGTGAGTGPREFSQRPVPLGLKPKDLIGIPWMLAFALRADGWYLRQDIIWAKPNPMPESVTDRCTKAHEYLFLLSKSERYYFDAATIAEPCSDNSHGSPRINPGRKNAAVRNDGGSLGQWPPTNPSRKIKVPSGWDTAAGTHGTIHREGRTKAVEYRETEQLARNRRSVWTVASQPFPEAHFATFPPALIEPCILAGCPRGALVLDPFGGAGTTGLVADRLGRDAVLIEINPAYAAMARRRIQDDAGMFAEVEAAE